MACKNLLRIVLFCCVLPKLFAVNCNKERKCRTSREYGLKTSDCYRMDWKEFPKCLPSNVEVVELSYNRIRKLTNSDIQRYPDLAHLYLTDNLLVNLDDELVRALSNIETLDLAVNAIGKISPYIFNLPKLKTLYLSQNLNINIAESIEEAKPIMKSSLTKLDISYITEDDSAMDFPDFGELPYLAVLNITGDQFNYLATKHFAGLCNLQVLANANVTADFESNCDCWKINQWLQKRRVQFITLSCPNTEEECVDQEIAQEDLDVYEACRDKFYEIERSILLEKVAIGIGITIGFSILLIALCLYRLWKRKLRRNKGQQIEHDVNKKDSLLEPIN